MSSLDHPPARQRALAALLHALIALVGRLPLRHLHALGALLGRAVRALNNRECRVSRRNLELCLPELEAGVRERLLAQSLVEDGRTLFETCLLWTRPQAENLALIREVEGEALFRAALSSGRGLIVAAPHLGNWELLNQYLAAQAPVSIVYRPPRQRFVELLLRRVRQHPGVTQVRAEAAGVRQLFRDLKAGGMLGILPDQQPKQGEGEHAPFFGLPALTMSLVSRLLERSEAALLFAFAERLPDAQGFRIVFLAPPEGIAGSGRQALAALNAGVEACVRRALPQYQWGYKRFSMQPHGRHSVYNHAGAVEREF
jgi:Kdo2-lipid IVA lauroyltransferase/acyltransferase